MKPRHAISTLFPYTTLFRSASGDVSAEAADTPGHPQHSAALAPQDDHEGNEERRRSSDLPTRAHNRHGCKHGESVDQRGPQGHHLRRLTNADRLHPALPPIPTYCRPRQMTWRPRSVLNRTTPWAQRCSAPPQETWTTDSEPAGYSASRTQPLLDDPSGSSRSGSHARSLDRKSVV